MKKSIGFTLIELLVVITILGLLSALGLGSYKETQKRSRDTRRKTDLKEIQSAQEQSYSINGYYANIGRAGSVCDTLTGILDILVPLPTDPKNSGNYIYKCHGAASGANNLNYCVIAKLEDTTKGNCTACACAATSCTITTGTTDFCVVNLQ